MRSSFRGKHIFKLFYVVGKNVVSVINSSSQTFKKAVFYFFVGVLVFGSKVINSNRSVFGGSKIKGLNGSGAVETFNLTPTENGTIGINNFGTEYQNAYKEVKYSFFESLGGGINYGYNILTDYVKQFKYVFTSKGASHEKLL